MHVSSAYRAFWHNYSYINIVFNALLKLGWGTCLDTLIQLELCMLFLHEGGYRSSSFCIHPVMESMDINECQKASSKYQVEGRIFSLLLLSLTLLNQSIATLSESSWSQNSSIGLFSPGYLRNIYSWTGTNGLSLEKIMTNSLSVFRQTQSSYGLFLLLRNSLHLPNGITGVTIYSEKGSNRRPHLGFLKDPTQMPQTLFWS